MDVRGLHARGGLVSAGILLVLAAAACTHEPSGKPSGSSAPPSLSAPSPAPASQNPSTVAQQALDAYRGMWQAYQQALQVPDPASPDLSKYATGTALAHLKEGVQSVRDKGLKGTGGVTVSPRITAFSPASAPTDIEVTDCLDDSQSHIVRVSPGPAYTDTPGGKHKVLATLQKQSDQSWKVTDFGVQAVGTC